jgi:hypothetical protein
VPETAMAYLRLLAVCVWCWIILPTSGPLGHHGTARGTIGPAVQRHDFS